LACGDQRRLTGNGSALEVLHDYALYKSTFTLLYFTFLGRSSEPLLTMQLQGLNILIGGAYYVTVTKNQQISLLIVCKLSPRKLVHTDVTIVLCCHQVSVKNLNKDNILVNTD